MLISPYAERVVNERLHQPLFRERVCTPTGVRVLSVNSGTHTPSWTAAHVLPDSAGGEPIVTNKHIAMCKIHHAAYDADIFGISPSYQVGVRPDVMEELDGPTLRYTLQAIDGSTIHRVQTERPHGRTRNSWRSDGEDSKRRRERANTVAQF